MIEPPQAPGLYYAEPVMETGAFFQAGYHADDKRHLRMLADMYRKYASVSQSVKIIK